MKRVKFVKFAPDKDFIRACSQDVKIEILSAQNNTYRTPDIDHMTGLHRLHTQTGWSIQNISYAGVRVVLGGDATADESWPDIMSRIALPKVAVLKASHHGRKSGYRQPAVKALSPWLTIM